MTSTSEEASRGAAGRPTLWVLVLAGPALRTSLLAALLVSQQSIGAALGLGADALAVLTECVIFGGLLAVFALPSVIATAGLRRVSIGAGAATVVCLAAAVVLAPGLSNGPVARAGLFVAAIITGLLAAVLSPISQTLLNNATTGNDPGRHLLQSLWAAGQPTGFIVASVFGGIVVQHVGWWAGLLVPLAFATTAALPLLDRRLFAAAYNPAPEPTTAFGGIALVIAALVTFEIWSTWGSLRSWFDPGVLAVLTATGVLAGMAVRQLRRSRRPAISVAPFSVPGFGAAAFILFLYQFPTTAEFEVLLLTELGNLSPEAIGNRSALGNFGQVCGTMAAAWLLSRGERGLALSGGLGLTLLGLAGYVFYPWHDGFGYASTTRIVTGVGGGLLTPVLFVTALAGMPVPLQLEAGTWLVLASIGGTEIGLVLFGMVLEFATRLSGSARVAFLTVEIVQLAVGAATALLGARLAAGGRLQLQPGPDRRSS